MKKKYLVAAFAVFACCFGVVGCVSNNGTENGGNNGNGGTDVYATSPTDGLAYTEVIDNYNNVIGYSVSGIGSASDSKIMIPAYYNGLPVTSVEANAFSGNNRITSICVAQSATLYSDSSSSANFMKTMAFSEDLSAGNLCEIGERAFYACPNLDYVSLTDDVTEIGDSAFSDTPFYDNEDNWENGGLYLQNHLVAVRTTENTFTVKEGTKYIDTHAFSDCTSLESVALPDSLVYLGTAAFINCVNLSDVNIPDGLSYTGGYAFFNTEIYNNENNWDNGALYIDNHLFNVSQTVRGVFEVRQGTISIAALACNQCEGITEVIIPDSLIIINERAFEWCIGLKRIEIGSGLSEIGEWAFAYCQNIGEISVSEDNPMYKAVGNCLIDTTSDTLVIGCKNSVIPTDGSVKIIGEYAFFDCLGLTGITIPDTVHTLGFCAFSECYSLETVNIPDSVTNVARGVFSGCMSLKKLTLPEGVTSIDSVASNCIGLTEAIVPDSLTVIGSSAFFECESLESFTIPEHVREIENYAFYRCVSLKSIYIPASVIYIDPTAFMNCTALESITVDPDNEYYYSSNNCLIDRNTRTVVLGCKNSLLPLDDGITAIGDYAFYRCYIESITIPESVTSIGVEAFCGCEKLIEVCNMSDLLIVKGYNYYSFVAYFALNVYNPESGKSNIVTTEDGFEFYVSGNDATLVGYTGTAEDITLPDSFNGGPYTVANNAFLGNNRIRSVTTGDSVTSIGSFASCTSLERVFLGNGITGLQFHMFYGCNKLKTVELGDNISFIETGLGGVFENCPSLENIFVSKNNGRYKSVGGVLYEMDGENLLLVVYPSGKPDKQFTVPDCVTYIYEAAFANAANLTEVILSCNITELREWTFSGCSSLESVVLPDSLEIIELWAFGNCVSLTHISVPDSVNYIAESAFNGCRSIESIIIPDSVSQIGCFAFSDCTSLTEIVLPAGLTYVGDYAFYRCCSIENVYFTGTGSPWDSVSIGEKNYNLTGADYYVYSETEPAFTADGTAYVGNFWRYVDNEIVVWVKETATN
ncbi:MAG: leucine-rich repeat protein [Candidatus Coproplasma sp.]